MSSEEIPKNGSVQEAEDLSDNSEN
jgi:hypothetical protein